MQLDASDPPNDHDIGFLSTLIDNADRNITVRTELLQRLGFARFRRIQPLLPRIEEILDRWVNPIRIVWLTILSGFVMGTILNRSELVKCAAVGKHQETAEYVGTSLKVLLDSCMQFIGCLWQSFRFDEGFARFALLLLGSFVAYYQWVRTKQNRSVEDAMGRKDKVNKLIIDNSNILLPYVGNVFDCDIRYAEKRLEDDERVKIDMFVFAEIDNLEFVFDKSTYGLIEEEYALRAIKIFVARAENEQFARSALRLIVNGRYNATFRRAAIKLIYVGHLARVPAG